MEFFFLAAFWLDFATGPLPRAVVGQPYLPGPIAVQGGARCTNNNVHTRVVMGELPEGITLSAAGYLRGIPRRTGSYSFLVRAGNDCAYSTRLFLLDVDGAPVLHVSEESLRFAVTQGSEAPHPQTFTVAANWRDMPYAIEGDQPEWLELRPLRGRTPLPESPLTGDPVTVHVDPAKLAPGVYRAVLRIAAPQVVEVQTVRIEVTVRPK